MELCYHSTTGLHTNLLQRSCKHDPPAQAHHVVPPVCLLCLQVQCVIDTWASAGERLQLAFSWTDPLATCVLLGLMLALAAGLWLLGLQVLVTAGLLWVFRCVRWG